MRNLIYFKIGRKLGRVCLDKKIVTEDLADRLSFGLRSASKPLSLVCEQEIIRITFDGFNSLPLFWGVDSDGAVIVSNRYDTVVQEVKPSTVDPVGFWELYLFETPLLSRTLFKEISVSQSGHELVIDYQSCRLERRFNFAYGKQLSSNDLIAKAHEILKNKLSWPIDNAIFPLSGGVDSRLILSYMYESLPKDTSFLTYGFSPKILENVYAKEILQLLYGNNYSHHFHVIDPQSYLESGLRGAKITGALAGVQNSHLLGYAQQTQTIGAPCILGMFADAIFGYGFHEQPSDWQTCSYAKKVKNFQGKGVLSNDLVEQILCDLKSLYEGWQDGSDISSFDEYLYVRERNGKFHPLLMSALQDYWNVSAPLNDPDLINFFMSLPNDLRKGKAIVSDILQNFFPKLRMVGDVSSSFRHGNSRRFHKLLTLANNILARKLRVLPIIPIYTDTERHDYSFIKYYKDEYASAIECVKGYLGINEFIVSSLGKVGSGMHGFQFISNAQVIKSILVGDDER